MEYFITTVTSQCHDNLSTSRFGDQDGRQLRCIRKRLVVYLGQAAHQGKRGLRRKVDLSVLGTEMPGRCEGLARLVDCGHFETDGEGTHRSTRLAGHAGDHQCRVNPTRKQRTDGYVCEHSQADRVVDRFLDRSQRGLLTILPGRCFGLGDQVLELPPALRSAQESGNAGAPFRIMG
ncbi:hypothetical protein N790_02615 [Arenimonas malthae CC-JY-1]|uniref:Uncharacterized protein n=1 Tax=Arenimonas malthae CC-JY-1 TaxID=1384054 RepID=A0A091AX84_9GAMM|nr:hypothetical protein N790_02615 [Arenimonas malthae CC-JY-1]